MPSPLVHLAAAAAIARQADQDDEPSCWRIWVVCTFFSMFPDLDAIAGVFMDDLSGYHNHATHSLLFGVAVCILGALVLKPFLHGWHHGRIAFLLTACYGSHLLLDWLTFGRGLKLLWPFVHTRYASPVPIFYGVRHSEGLFSYYHLITITTELAFVAAGYMIYRLQGVD